MIRTITTPIRNRILALHKFKQTPIQIKHILERDENIVISVDEINNITNNKIIYNNEKFRNLSATDIELIGELTRRNKTINTVKIKEVLNLNASIDEINEAIILFPWNNNNNSDDKEENYLDDSFIKESVDLSKTPTEFSVRIFRHIFDKNELSNALREYDKSNKTTTSKLTYLDQKRINYIKNLVKLNYSKFNIKNLWPSCCKSMQLVCSNINEDSSDDAIFNYDADSMKLNNDDSLDNEDGDMNDSQDNNTNTNDDIEMINTNKANEVMIKNKCSLNLIDDYFVVDERYNLNLLTEKEINLLKNSTISPMVFSTKILLKIFDKDELIGRSVSGKSFHREEKPKKPIDEIRLMYIKWLVEKHFKHEFVKNSNTWKRCCKAINRAARKYDKVPINKSIEKIENA